MDMTLPMCGARTPRSTGLGGGGARWGRALAALSLFGSALPAVAQPKDAGQAFKATVQSGVDAPQRVIVSLHRSVTVDTSVEVTRADVINRNIADVQVISATRMLITGQSFGETSIVLLGKDGQQRVLEIAVELDLTAYNAAIKNIDPYSTAEARSLRGNIVLTGTVSGTERAQRMLELAELFLPPATQGGGRTKVQNQLEIAGEQQVLLRCVVAEMNRSASRELGINGFLAGENFRDGFVVNQIGGINPINIGAAADANVRQNIPFLTGSEGIPVAPASTLSLGFPRVQTQLFLKAMADNKLLRVLAEPNLVAISGETASFLAGGEFPIPVPQGNQTVTIEFKEFGVRLNFTPIVRGNDKIRLRVAPEVSELDFTTAAQFQGFVIPGLTSRATSTTIELGSGQTIAIAGLLNDQVRGIATRVPGVGDVPVLGSLFRSVSFQRSLSELVILVTPELVAPMDAHQNVPLPGRDHASPNDLELYALGMLEAPPSAGAQTAKTTGTEAGSDPNDPGLHGPWGHASETETR